MAVLSQLVQLLQQRRLRFGIVAVKCFPLAAIARVTRIKRESADANFT
jgi:hypothetical protein